MDLVDATDALVVSQAADMAGTILPALAYVAVMACVYAVGGWLWETAYCSLVERRYVRRGVLYGPACPLYGFAAVAIYYPLRDVSSPLLVFLLGALLATVMEYGTAVALESAFHKSFWDYDNLPLNYRGRICLPASVTFGGFALVVRYITQPLLEPALASVPTDRLCDVGLAVVVVFVVDLAMSARRWDLDTTRMPAHVATIVQRVPDSVRTPEEIAEIASDAIRRVSEDWDVSDRWEASGWPSHAERIRLVSASRIADGRLFVTARIGEVRSVLLTVGEHLSSLAGRIDLGNDDASVIRRAVMSGRPAGGTEGDGDRNDGDDANGGEEHAPRHAAGSVRLQGGGGKRQPTPRSRK